MPKQISKQAVLHFILSISNNPVPMPIDRSIQLFEAAVKTRAIVKVGSAWQGNPNWKPL